MSTTSKHLLWLPAVLLLPSLAIASVWLPSDAADSVNITISNPGHAQLGIFSAGSLNSASKPLLTFTGGTSVKFVRDGSNWEISAAGHSARLGGSEKFQLGRYANGTWITENSAVHDSANLNVWQLAFQDESAINTAATVTVANIRQDEAVQFLALPAEKHLPVTVWLALGGFLLFLALNKQRRSRRRLADLHDHELDVIANE